MTRGVVQVHDGFGAHRLWPWECLHCWHVWEEPFTVRSGDRGDVWLRGGVVVQPPWAGATCPACGGFSVTAFPEGYLDRHPELLAAPDPGPARPALLDVVASPAVAARAPRHHRLLVVLGVPVLLLAAAYEVYRVVTAAAGPH